jgi:predicted tellurium resistance membrane protein TerC
MRILAGLAAFLLGGALVAAGVELLGPTPWVLAGFGVLLFMASAAWLARAKAASARAETPP